jgi:hypothetical protein
MYRPGRAFCCWLMSFAGTIPQRLAFADPLRTPLERMKDTGHHGQSHMRVLSLR